MPKISDEQLKDLAKRYNKNSYAIAKETGMDHSNIARRLRNMKKAGITIDAPESEDLDIEDIIAKRRKEFAKKQRHEEGRRLIPIRVQDNLPIGLLHFGDPHLDNPGTNIDAIDRHMKLCRNTDGLYGCSIGDVTDNWVGRLARLYAHSSTTTAEAWKLAEWFVNGVPWMYLVGGNHDLWSGSGDPLTWITKSASALYQDSECRVELKFPNKRSVRINARHDFAGHSMYNPVHGATKALHFGIRDHIAVCGHKHVSGYGVLKDPDSGITMHALQIASYKIYDRYAREKGFRDQMLSPCAVTVIDPTMDPQHPDLIKVFWDADEGAEFLKYKRKRAKTNA